ncbi:25883_t:CDS:2 [Racocetra persica]|uniref:25883_t:CDS:1 n=1 Tax=Racocetra persica TaxID=160502 RepID=A0ACA9KJD3_9GLOM|nr:25883_t:CDS:2 [Racocetra persica]
MVASEEIPKDIHFNMWDEVEDYFNEYGARNRFAVTKYQMERNILGQIHKRTFYINLSILEQATQISVTTFVNQHNHTLVPETQNFGVKYKTLSKEALDKINIITRHIAKDYLLRVLDLRSRLWARAYLYRIFITGIESTARVESYN